MTALRQATYSPDVFDVSDINEAKRIILTPDGASTDERWRRETPYLLDLISESFDLDEHSLVLDYGCGVGRMSKAMIDRFGCRVVGADISPSMRALAAAYVSDDRFYACHPQAVDWSKPAFGFDLAIAVWALQHCRDVEEDVRRIKFSLDDEGPSGIFVVNDYRRLVPTDRGWADDGKNVAALVDDAMFGKQLGVGAFLHPLDPSHVGEAVASCSYWAAWENYGATGRL